MPGTPAASQRRLVAPSAIEPAPPAAAGPAHSLIRQSFKSRERTEPLSEEDGWTSVPPNHLVLIGEDRRVRLTAL